MVEALSIAFWDMWAAYWSGTLLGIKIAAALTVILWPISSFIKVAAKAAVAKRAGRPAGPMGPGGIAH